MKFLLLILRILVVFQNFSFPVQSASVSFVFLSFYNRYPSISLPLIIIIISASVSYHSLLRSEAAAGCRPSEWGFGILAETADWKPAQG